MNKKPHPLDEPINVTMTRTDRVSILAALSVTILQARLEHDDSLLQKHIHARDAMLREPQPTVDTARYKALWESIPWEAIAECAAIADDDPDYRRDAKAVQRWIQEAQK